MNIVVFTKPTFCPQCNHTKNFLKSKDVDFTEKDVYTDDVAADLMSRGASAAPIVALIDEDGIVEDFHTGFVPNKLSEYIERTIAHNANSKESVLVGASVSNTSGASSESDDIWDF